MTAAIPDGPVVIIGGGVVGCSLAFHLAKYGHDAVTVVEAALLGEGATSKATGGIRQQFSSRLNADLCREAVDYFAHFEERVGEPFHFRQHGYLFLLGTEAQREQFERDVAMQQSLGIDVRLVGNDDIGDLMPGIRTADLYGAAYTPEDGSGSPVDATAAFARQARTRGTTVLQNTRVTGVERSPGGAVAAVRTDDGDRLEAAVVVNAAGPAAAQVGRLVGLELPVEPHPRQAFGIDAMEQLSPTMPLTVDLTSGAYVHPETHGGIVGGNDRNAPAGDEAKVRWELSEGVISSLIERIPWMEHARITSGWCGLREMTPDDHAIVGPCDVEGWWNLAGFSGHGFMQAPVVGDHVARWMVGLEDRRDLSPLALGRFTSGDLHRESTVF
jgi:glycine/D-amino acid oxidase-like deaminating enzyme